MLMHVYCPYAQLKSLFACILYVSLWILNECAGIVNGLAGILNGPAHLLKRCVRINWSCMVTIIIHVFIDGRPLFFL